MVCTDDEMPPLLQSSSKKVCVVGAGMAGLAAALELLREGHAVTVMEQCRDVGGQWLYDPRADDDDGVAAAPVKVHSSMYASARMLGPRDNLSFSGFPFAPRGGGEDGSDPRRFPGHREVYCYLRDFCDAFGLSDAVRLNTRVVRVVRADAAAPGEEAGTGGGGFSESEVAKWRVRSVRVEPEETGEEEVAAVEEEEEEFDAVVVASGHYSQPRLPTIDGMDGWRRRQLHSHSYRVPEPFRGEVVLLVGCGDSGLDIALDLVGVSQEVHLSARSVDAAMTPAMSKMLHKYTNLRLHPQVDRLREDGMAVFADGAGVAVDTIIYCTGTVGRTHDITCNHAYGWYNYSFPFLDTGGLVTVDDNRMAPLFEHTFPPSLAPSLSFVGIPRKVFVPWLLEAQGRWIARVLSGRSTLPPVEEMLRAADEFYRGRDAAGVPRRYTHDIGGVDPNEMHEFVATYTPDMPRMERKMEFVAALFRNINDDRETFRDLDYGDAD